MKTMQYRPTSKPMTHTINARVVIVIAPEGDDIAIWNNYEGIGGAIEGWDD